MPFNDSREQWYKSSGIQALHPFLCYTGSNLGNYDTLTIASYRNLISWLYVQYDYMYNMSTNNDCLVELDPDHNILENGTVKKCSNYDTSLQFNKEFSSENNISVLHLNICSS